MRIALDLSDELAAKLSKLAAARGRSPERCLVDFIATAQPGGVGWEHPAKAKPAASATNKSEVV